MAKAIKKASAADLERNITASRKEAARLKLKIEGRRRYFVQQRIGYIPWRSTSRMLKKPPQRFTSQFASPYAGTSAKRAVPTVGRPHRSSV